MRSDLWSTWSTWSSWPTVVHGGDLWRDVFPVSKPCGLLLWDGGESVLTARLLLRLTELGREGRRGQVAAGLEHDRNTDHHLGSEPRLWDPSWYVLCSGDSQDLDEGVAGRSQLKIEQNRNRFSTDANISPRVRSSDQTSRNTPYTTAVHSSGCSSQPPQTPRRRWKDCSLLQLKKTLPRLPVTAVRTSLSIWYFSLWSSGRIFSSTFNHNTILSCQYSVT